MAVSLRRVLLGPATLLTYAMLVVPLAIGWLETDLMSPLALPGYLIYVIGSAIGHTILPWLDLRLYWIPFLVGCYGVAAVVGLAVEWVRDSSASAASGRSEGMDYGND